MLCLLRKIFRQYMNEHERKQMVTRILSSSPDTQHDTMQAIYTLLKPRCPTFPSVERRQEFIVRQIVTVLSSKEKTLSSSSWSNLQFMDVGGGDGFVLHFLSSLSDKKPICMETRTDWNETYTFPYASTVDYHFWDNVHMATVETHSVDVVFCMVSLHHMNEETVANCLREIRRVLKPGGLFMIKEHDCISETAQLLIEWEHHLYHIRHCLSRTASTLRFTRHVLSQMGEPEGDLPLRVEDLVKTLPGGERQPLVKTLPGGERQPLVNTRSASLVEAESEPVERLTDPATTVKMNNSIPLYLRSLDDWNEIFTKKYGFECIEWRDRLLEHVLVDGIVPDDEHNPSRLYWGIYKSSTPRGK